jgi:predicted nucleotidyltransferase
MDPIESGVAQRIEDLAATLRRVLESGSPEGVRAVFLYGSVLSRLFRPDSDIDVAVLDSPEQPLDWHAQARLMDALERATGRNVDLRLLRASSPSHQAHVLEHGRLIWTRDSGEVERYTRKALAVARQSRERSARELSQVLDRLAGLATPR